MVQMSRDGMHGTEELAEDRSGGRDYMDNLLDQWRAVTDQDTTSVAISGRIMRAALYYEASMMRYTFAHNLTVGDGLLLSALRRSGPPFSLRPSELVKFLWVTPSGITKQVRRLVAGGLVKKERDRRDERAVVITLTKRGQKMADSSLAAQEHQPENQLILKLSAAERAELECLLKKLLVLLETHNLSPQLIYDPAPQGKRPGKQRSVGRKPPLKEGARTVRRLLLQS
jgi:DNA-binding MarR family transcriptional regulator